MVKKFVSWVPLPILVLGAAQAQTVGDARQSSEIAIEEIVVTATKRETRLFDTPLSISVVGSENLRDLGALNFDDYAAKVAGLTAVDEGPGRKTYIIRGVNNLDAPGAQATVAQYLDEIPITNNQGRQPDPLLVDIDRVEVLRGPQGTLFGARSMAGAVRTITRKPVMNAVEGFAKAEYSNVKYGGAGVSLNGAVNIPLVDDELALRVAGYVTDRDGYIDNRFPGGVFTPTNLPPGLPPPPPVVLDPVSADNINDYLAYGGRAILRWQPTDRLTVDLMGMLQLGRIDGSPFYFRDATGDESEGLITEIVNSNGSQDDSVIANTTATYTLDWAELTGTASYFNRDTFSETFDQTASIATRGGPGSSGTFGSDRTAFALEGRLATTLDGPLQFVGGVYYYDEKREGEVLRFIAFEQAVIDSSLFDARQDEIAVFGEVSYTAIDRLTLTAGVRYSDFSSALFRTFIISPPQSGIPPGPEADPPRYSGDAVTVKGVADYKISDDLFVFVQAAEGTRPGGFNQEATAGLTTFDDSFDPDSLWSYEAGLRADLLEGRLFFDTAVFLIDWDDIIVQSFQSVAGGPPGAGRRFQLNAGSAEISGFDLQLTARPVPGLTADLAFSHYFKAELTEGFPPNDGNLTAQPGDPLPYVASTYLGAGLQYRRPIYEGWDATVRLDWQHVGDRTSGFRPLNDDGLPNNAYNEFESYSRINLRAGVVHQGWRMDLFVNNLTDSRPVINAQNFYPFPVQSRVTITPRTFGISVERKF